MIKYVPQSDFDRVFEIAIYSFPHMHEAKDKIKDYLYNYLKPDYILGYYDDDVLMAQVMVIPYQIYINKRTVDMGGVAMVSSLPEGRHGGKIAQLLKEWLLIMKNNGVPVSMLGPFSFEFYRKYGWEMGYMRKYYNIPIEHIKSFKKRGRMVPAGANDISILNALYDKYAMQHNGPAKRDSFAWNKFIITNPWDDAYGKYTYLYYENETPKGYIIYSVKKNIFGISELVYMDESSLKGILYFIYSHQAQADEATWSAPMDTMLEYLLPNPRIKIENHPGMMFRVVDVANALIKKGNPGVNASIKIKINDGAAEWNNKAFCLDYKNNDIEVKDTAYFDIECDIQTFSQIYLGFISPLEAYNLGKLRGNENSISEMSKVFTKVDTFNNDGF